MAASSAKQNGEDDFLSRARGPLWSKVCRAIGQGDEIEVWESTPSAFAGVLPQRSDATRAGKPREG